MTWPVTVVSKLKWSAETESSTLTVLVGLPFKLCLICSIYYQEKNKMCCFVCVCVCVYVHACMHVCVCFKLLFSFFFFIVPVELFFFGPVLVCIYTFLCTLLIWKKKNVCVYESFRDMKYFVHPFYSGSLSTIIQSQKSWCRKHTASANNNMNTFMTTFRLFCFCYCNTPVFVSVCVCVCMCSGLLNELVKHKICLLSLLSFVLSYLYTLNVVAIINLILDSCAVLLLSNSS